MSPRPPRPDDRSGSLPVDLICLLLSVVVHLFLLIGSRSAATLQQDRDDARVHLGSPVYLTVTPTEVPEEPLQPEDPVVRPLDGQLVEVAPPDVERTPREADYLSEFDITVPEETRAPRYKVNPDVLAPTFSETSQVKSEHVESVEVDDPGSGATVGQRATQRFDPARDGRLANLPSPFSRTNVDGTDWPAAGAETDAMLAGAPQNDLLRERVGEATQLNTKEYLYASYLKRIRRLVNFYWQQNLDNLPGSVRLANPEYTTGVEAILDADGTLELVSVVAKSGSPELDEAVVRAFHIAGPFPHPPEGLVEKDGRVYLPSMGFTVQLGVARAQYQGVDPRSGVQFPGILKSPR